VLACKNTSGSRPYHKPAARNAQLSTINQPTLPRFFSFVPFVVKLLTSFVHLRGTSFVPFVVKVLTRALRGKAFDLLTTPRHRSASYKIDPISGPSAFRDTFSIMITPQSRPEFPNHTQPTKILSGWKDIANYLGKGVRTVQRYEHTLRLPVRHPAGRRRGSVLATQAELDAWVAATPFREVAQPGYVSPAHPRPQAERLRDAAASQSSSGTKNHAQRVQVHLSIKLHPLDQATLATTLEHPGKREPQVDADCLNRETRSSRPCPKIEFPFVPFESLPFVVKLLTEPSISFVPFVSLSFVPFVVKLLTQPSISFVPFVSLSFVPFVVKLLTQPSISFVPFVSLSFVPFVVKLLT
jgi:hypothetical protein